MYGLVIESYTLQVIPQERRREALEIISHLVAPRGILLVITRARNEEEPSGELPDFYQDRRVYHYDITKTIETFKYLSLEFSPGEKFEYSNFGYILLGYIIEKVTQSSFENYIEQGLLQRDLCLPFIGRWVCGDNEADFV